MYYRSLSLLTIVMFAVCAFAQMNELATPHRSLEFDTVLSGTVHDGAGNPVNGARVELIDTSTGRSVVTVYTGVDGRFDVQNLRRADYEAIATQGTNESRVRFQAGVDNDISLRLQGSEQVSSNQAIVSVTQMNVPSKARHLLEKAEQAFSKAQIDNAFGFVQKALLCYPNYAKALVLRGILKMQKGDDNDAKPDLEKAVQLDYGYDMGYVALASLYNNEGQFDRAEQTLDHSMSLNPKSWQANLEMARSLLGKGDFGGAVRSLDRAATFAPPTVTLLSLYRAQALIGLKDYQGAIAQLQTYLDKSPNDANSENARNTLAKLKAFTASEQK